jgi:DNA-binding FadR family transcriptional regulator
VAEQARADIEEERADAALPEVSDAAAVSQLRAFILENGYAAGDRLPPERRLGPELGLRRLSLRRAMEVLVNEGVLWRHVGKGTFLAANQERIDSDGLNALARDISPADAMRARAVFEPAIAREAALHATAAAIEHLGVIADRSRQSATWREYEVLDADFHRSLAEACASPTLLALFDKLNTLRRMVSWGKARPQWARPPASHPSFAEHDAIVAAITARDTEAAEAAMRHHLVSVALRFDT